MRVPRRSIVPEIGDFPGVLVYLGLFSTTSGVLNRGLGKFLVELSSGPRDAAGLRGGDVALRLLAAEERGVYDQIHSKTRQ